jgi:hypothetical protein
MAIKRALLSWRVSKPPARKRDDGRLVERDWRVRCPARARASEGG